jgi:hypothetical protein
MSAPRPRRGELFGEGDVTEKLFGHYAVVVTLRQDFRAMANRAYFGMIVRNIHDEMGCGRIPQALTYCS